ncbi:MAG: phosphatase [Clostridia bacterium]
MEILFDLHTHTLASGHAYSTIRENVAEAKNKGLLAYGFSDHAEKMPGSTGNLYFVNFAAIPDYIDGVRVYCGVEANIMDYDGTLDINKRVESKVDYIIASMHMPCIAINQDIETVTRGLVNVMQNPKVKIIGHPDDSRYPCDYDIVVREAVRTNTILELNNSSLGPRSTRENPYENMKEMLAKCIKYGAKVIINSDAHYCGEVGEVSNILTLLEEVNFPEELVINTSLEGLKLVINEK